MKKIKLAGGQIAFVDDQDYVNVSKYSWHVITSGTHQKSVYAGNVRRIKNSPQKTTYMHRLIMKAKRGQYIDHIDGNGLNNTRENLRFCTLSQNQGNRLGWETKHTKAKYKGVRKYQHDNTKWTGHVTKNGKTTYLGLFNTAEEAREAVIINGKKLHGAFYKYV